MIYERPVNLECIGRQLPMVNWKLLQVMNWASTEKLRLLLSWFSIRQSGTLALIPFFLQALNDDLPSTLTVHQVAETRSKIDCRSGRHFANNVLWTPY